MTKSFNGTFVNNKKVGKGNKVKLQPNDEISLSAPNTKYESKWIRVM